MAMRKNTPATNNQNDRWVKVYEKIMDNPISRKPNYLAIFLYLVLKANYQEKTIIWNNKPIKLERGSLITSISKIAEHFSLSTGTVTYVLDYLKAERMIERSSNFSFTVVKVLNYDKYQSFESKVESELKANEKRVESELKHTIKNRKIRKNISSRVGVSYEQEMGEVLNTFNKVKGTKYYSTREWSGNYKFWREKQNRPFDYILDAIKNFPNAKGEFWENMSPAILFRQANSKGDECDYIQDLLNFKPKKTEDGNIFNPNVLSKAAKL